MACSMDRLSVMLCGIKTYSSVPAEFDYFSGGGHLGTLSAMDYCPAFAGTIKKCFNHSSTWTPYPANNFMREFFHHGSRCLMSTLRGNVRQGEQRTRSTSNNSPRHSNMLPRTCAADMSNYVVGVTNLADGTAMTLGTCSRDGQTLPGSGVGLQGVVTCASPTEVCKGVVSVSVITREPWAPEATNNTNGRQSPTTAGTTKVEVSGCRSGFQHMLLWALAAMVMWANIPITW